MCKRKKVPFASAKQFLLFTGDLWSGIKIVYTNLRDALSDIICEIILMSYILFETILILCTIIMARTI